MRGHGNWCGPGWTAGQYKDAADLTDEDRAVPAIDKLDAACKAHDIGLHDHPEQADEINKEFVSTVKGMGIKGALFALAVGLAGPKPTPKESKSFYNWQKCHQTGLQQHASGDKIRTILSYYTK